MHKAEIRLIYPCPTRDEDGVLHAATEDYTEIVNVTCPTELATYADELLRHSGAEVCNFNFISEKP